MALFLAGLRRANEKADLLSRAKGLDQDSELGWRQDGRAIILQLLQEGVLASPGHVQQDSLSFLLELVDPRILRARNEPRDLISALSRLVKASASKSHSAMLDQFLTDSNTWGDDGSLSRLYHVASFALADTQILQHAKVFESANRSRTARVRLVWPKVRPSHLIDASGASDYWPKLPDPSWAAVWYRLALKESAYTALGGPVKYHQLLVEEFCFTSLPARIDAGLDDAGFLSPRSDWAIWTLCANLQKLGALLTGKGGDHEKIEQPLSSVTLAGLDEDVSPLVEELTKASSAAVNGVLRDKGSQVELANLLASIERGLNDDGLKGWIACRCGITLLGGGRPRPGCPL